MQIFKSSNINVPANQKDLFDQFIKDEENTATINDIIQNQNRLMTKWKLSERNAAIMQQPVRILNATVGKAYETKFASTTNLGS